MNDLLTPVSNSNWHCVPSNNLPNVYPCSDMGNDSSALSLSHFALSDLPKYIVLRSKFSSNLVVLTTSNWIPSYTSRYSFFNTSGVTLKSSSTMSSFSFVLIFVFIYSIDTWYLCYDKFWHVCHTVCNSKHCLG